MPFFRNTCCLSLLSALLAKMTPKTYNRTNTNTVIMTPTLPVFPRLVNPRATSAKSITFAKESLSTQLFKDPDCWFGRGLNLRPSAQQTGAYPLS